MSQQKLQNGHSLNADEVSELAEVFEKFDLDHNGHIDAAELCTVLKECGADTPGYKAREYIQKYDVDKNNTIEFEEFLQIYSKESSNVKAKAEFENIVSKVEKMQVYTGDCVQSAEGTTHSFSDYERVAFVDWINSSLGEDQELHDLELLPIKSAEGDLFTKVKNGILLCKLINLSAPETVDERAINKTKLNIHKVYENQILALNSASAIGCFIVNIGPDDLQKGIPHLVLGLLWQIIRIGLLAKINLANVPGLARLLRDGETMDDLMNLTPDELLLRWVNYHLEKSGSTKQIKNFGSDIKDSEAYTILLSQIAPPEFRIDQSPMNQTDLTKRAEKVLVNADRMHCRKFVRPSDIVKGHTKLNMAFVANLFNTYPCLPPLDENDQEYEEVDYEETREELTFRNWMNSLGTDPFVNHLYNGLQDGIVLFQLFDKIKPGIVNFDKVNRRPFKTMGGKMKRLENCNYAIELGYQLKFSLVGVGGADINDRNKTLVLALVWQMMRAYTLKILQQLAGSDKPLGDKEVVIWVNEKLAASGKASKISSFKDSSIASSKPVIDLIDAIRPNSINYDLVKNGKTHEDQHDNAKYALSMARKIGAVVYALPEDLVEVNPKMVLTVFACLMATGLKNAPKKQ